MATEKQIAANRANAQKSTGPKTAAGRLKSSRNAYRHGLSLPQHLDMSTSTKADAIARALVHDQAGEEEHVAAAEVARAQLELLRIRAARAQLMLKIDLASGNLTHLKRLAALDRYERRAATKRPRASHKLSGPRPARINRLFVRTNPIFRGRHELPRFARTKPILWLRWTS